MELRSENERWSIPAPDMEASPLTAEGMRELEADFSKVKIVKYIRDVEFANIDGVSLKLQLLLPSTVGDGEKRPLVLFIRGSAERGSGHSAAGGNGAARFYRGKRGIPACSGISFPNSVGRRLAGA